MAGGSPFLRVNHELHLWDLWLLRRELSGFGLDWDFSQLPVLSRETPLSVELKMDAP